MITLFSLVWLAGFVMPLVNAVTTCEQGTNCVLPFCFCANAGIPSKIHPRDVPQMVIIAMEGNLDSQRDKLYEKLFPNYQRNPNGCPISGTFFVPGENTDVSLLMKWYDRGMEIALNSQLGVPSYNYWDQIKREQMKKEVLIPWELFTRDGKIPKKDIRGYRNPAFFAAGNVQYQVLEYESFTYDASLRVRRRTISETNYWPSTLDFPWGYRCDYGKCPTNSYPGLWAVPSVTLFNGTEADRFSTNLYTYTTAFPTKSKQEMFDFLWNNFIAFYDHGRSPFILNMNTVGFLGEDGEEKLKAHQAFFTKALEKKGVFFISMHKLIEWVKAPMPLNKINEFLPWSCSENTPEYHKSRKKGTPLAVNQLGRKSKANLLWGRSDSYRIEASFVLLLLLSLLHVLVKQ